ncbi:uncharacterized protein N7482_007810 [Penicillium canariense]|uniref:Uncharacterized protein n=1 Tax=Penicillium canariense TaxID=189055 RepID=A0A9W9I047_9EURO|nr:uncharacterized protein N7482_007810 [Penicillium canariense]KAJ5160806.1 hypothetical protein N7482_007810 [Penicillium canariense]
MSSRNQGASPTMSPSSTGANPSLGPTSTAPVVHPRYASNDQFAMDDPDQPIELSGTDHKPAFPPKFQRNSTSSSSQLPPAETYQSRDVGTGRLYYHNQGPEQNVNIHGLGGPPPMGHTQYTPSPQDYYHHQDPRLLAQQQQRQYQQRPDGFYAVSQAPAPQVPAQSQDDYYHPLRQAAPSRMQPDDLYHARQAYSQAQPSQSQPQPQLQQYYHARQVPQRGEMKSEADPVDQPLSRVTPETMGK